MQLRWHRGDVKLEYADEGFITFVPGENFNKRTRIQLRDDSNKKLLKTGLEFSV